MKLTKRELIIPFALVTLLSLTAVGWAQTKGNQLAAKRYVDPKGYFKIVPPAGWQVQEYSQDPRGKVAFLAPDGRLGIIVQADGIGTIDELVNLSKQMETRLGTSTNIEKTQVSGRQVVKRSFEMKGQRMFSVSFLSGSMTHNITFTAGPESYKKYISVATKSMETYEPTERSASDKDISEQQATKKVRLAQLMIDQGNYDLALDFIKEGLEWSPRNAELLDLKKEVESRRVKQ